MQKSSINIRRTASAAMLVAISFVLTFFSFPIPGFPPFLKLDISSLPVMIGSFALGPIAGVLIAALKSLLDLLFGSNSAGVGQLADFMITASFALTAGVIYRFNKSKKGALIASVASIFTITIVGAFANYFILLPFYAKVYMPMDTILAVCQKINPNITSVGAYIFYAAVPFNLLKGAIIAALTFLLYKRISNLINKFSNNTKK